MPPRLGSEVTAQEEKREGERNDADKPHNWISGVEHSQNCNRYLANSCTFNPDGKSGAARMLPTAILLRSVRGGNSDAPLTFGLRGGREPRNWSLAATGLRDYALSNSVERDDAF